MKNHIFYFITLFSFSSSLLSQTKIVDINYPTDHLIADGAISITISPISTLYKYFWNTGDTSSSINELSEGDYSVTITGGLICWEELHFHLTSCDDTLITNPLTVERQIFWNSENNTGNVFVFAEGGANERFYRWSDGEVIISYDRDLINKPQGIYYLSVFDGCNQINDTITLGSPPTLPLKSGDKSITELNGAQLKNHLEESDLDDFHLYPNPFDKEFIIKAFTVKKGIFEISVYDILGKEVYNFKRYSFDKQWSEKIPIKEIYASGVYNVQIKHEGKRIFIQSMVKMN